MGDLSTGLAPRVSHPRGSHMVFTSQLRELHAIMSAAPCRFTGSPLGVGRPAQAREDQQVRIARGHAGNWLQGGRKVFQVADLPEQRGVSEEEGAAESHKRGEEESGRIGVGARGRARRLGLAPVV